MRHALLIVVVFCLVFAILFSLDYPILHRFFVSDWKYEPIIKTISNKYGIDHRLVKAVIYQESRFNANAAGRAGEVGLMQIMQKTAVQDWADAHGVQTPSRGLLFSPRLNIEIGAWYLAKALNRWKDYNANVELALCQYNAGESRAENWKPPTCDGEIIPAIKIKSTKEYVNAVMKRYRGYISKDEQKN